MLFKVLTVEELTEDAFLKSEHLKALQIMNTPTDFEDRKKAFIELAVAERQLEKQRDGYWPPSTTRHRRHTRRA
jgi:hypothetical protein